MVQQASSLLVLIKNMQGYNTCNEAEQGPAETLLVQLVQEESDKLFN